MERTLVKSVSVALSMQSDDGVGQCGDCTESWCLTQKTFALAFARETSVLQVGKTGTTGPGVRKISLAKNTFLALIKFLGFLCTMRSLRCRLDYLSLCLLCVTSSSQLIENKHWNEVKGAGQTLAALSDAGQRGGIATRSFKFFYQATYNIGVRRRYQVGSVLVGRLEVKI